MGDPGAGLRDDRIDRRDANRAIAVSAGGLGLTGIVELAIALLSGSAGLLGDALHNLSDVGTSLAVFVGLRLSLRPPSSTHPYGWERAEDLAGLGVAGAILVSGVTAAVVSVHKLVEHGTTSHVGAAIAAAGVGVLGNQVVARYKRRVGLRIRSAALVADAEHSWLDALSSAGALVGLVGVAAGLRWADGVAGLVVTALIARVGYGVARELLGRLMDAVAPEILRASERAATSVAGVERAEVRARWMGRSLVVEVEAFVAPATTVAATDALASSVRDAVVAVVPGVTTVRVAPRPASSGA